MPEICNLIEDVEKDDEVDAKETQINGDCQTSSNWHIKYWEKQPPGDMIESGSKLLEH